MFIYQILVQVFNLVLTAYKGIKIDRNKRGGKIMNVNELAKEILKQVGGKENVSYLTNCMTRLRFNLKSVSEVNEAQIKNIPGVMGVANKGGQFQIIIGTEVAKVCKEIKKIGNLDNQSSVLGEERDKGVVSKVLDIIAGIFSQLLPVITGAGMIKALLSLLVLFNLINKTGTTYYFLNFIADSAFYFLPVFLASSAARKFKCNQNLAMLMAGILLHPSFVALKTAGDPVSFLGLPVKLATYSSSVIPIILIVWALSYVEQFAEKIVPSVVKFVAKPLLILLIMSPIALIILGPLGSIVGDGLAAIILSVEGVAPWLIPTLLGIFMPFLVMTGMHYSLVPAYVNQIAAYGYETIVGAGNLPSNIAQGAAALCVACKTKNKDLKQLAISSGFTALLGITEPAMFGINLRLKRPMFAVMVGGGVGGFYAGIMGVQRYGGGASGLASIGLFMGDDASNIIHALISCLIAFIVTFMTQWFIGFEDVVEKEKEVISKGNIKITEKRTIMSPLKGQVVPLSEVNDEVFSNEVMGKGIAIIPSEGKLYSPVEGTVVALFDTKHAIGIQTEDGADILLHIGLDTVELGGEYFTAYITTGSKVKAGDLLVEFDHEAIRLKGYDLVTSIVVTNSNQYLEVLATEDNYTNVGQQLLTLI